MSRAISKKRSSAQTVRNSKNDAASSYPPFGSRRHLGYAVVTARFPGMAKKDAVTAKVPCNIHTILPGARKVDLAGIKIALPPPPPPQKPRQLDLPTRMGSLRLASKKPSSTESLSSSSEDEDPISRSFTPASTTSTTCSSPIKSPQLPHATTSTTTRRKKNPIVDSSFVHRKHSDFHPRPVEQAPYYYPVPPPPPPPQFFYFDPSVQQPVMPQFYYQPQPVYYPGYY